jgi:hypothetical protein
LRGDILARVIDNRVCELGALDFLNLLHPLSMRLNVIQTAQVR